MTSIVCHDDPVTAVPSVLEAHAAAGLPLAHTETNDEAGTPVLQAAAVLAHPMTTAPPEPLGTTKEDEA